MILKSLFVKCDFEPLIGLTHFALRFVFLSEAIKKGGLWNGCKAEVGERTAYHTTTILR